MRGRCLSHLRGAMILALLVGIMIVTGCAEDDVVLPPGHSVAEPDQVLVNPHIVISEGGLTSTVITAKVINIFQRENRAELRDSVMVEFYNNRGEHTTTLTADHGEIWGFNDHVDSLKAEGNVEVMSAERDAALEAPAVRWISDEQKIYGEGEVLIRSEDGLERGTGFVANDDLTEYEFTGPIRGEYRGGNIPDLEEE